MFKGNGKSIPIIFFVLFLTGIIIYTVSYIKNERYFYFWDFVAYQDTANNFLNLAKIHNPLLLFESAWNSLKTDYNFFWVFPIIPFLFLLNPFTERLSFVLSILMVYHIPLTVIIASLVTKISHNSEKGSIPILLGVMFLTPAFWIPTLRGYPDVGGSLILFVAVTLYLSNHKREWLIYGLMGVILAISVIFRKHFAYEVLAFYLALCFVSTHEFIIHLRNGKKRLPTLLLTAKPILISGLFTVTSFLIVWPFTQNLVEQFLMDAYSSWEKPSLEVLRHFSNYFGLLSILFSFLGWFSFIIIRKRIIPTQSVHFFLPVFTSLCVFNWIVFSRQENPHYLVHFSAWIILGISFLIIHISKRFNGYKKIIGISLIFGSLFLNFAYTIFPGFRESPIGKSVLFNHDTQPLSSPDYDEYRRLINDLRFEFADQTIYVVDSSATLNADLLQNAERMLYPNQNILDFISSPSIDSRDRYPIGSLMQADLVILSKPHQFHLKPEDQEIVSVIYKVFDESWDISKDFVKTDFEYHFTPNISTYIYQRKTPTGLSNAVKTFHKIQVIVEPNPPGGQDDWVRLSYITDDHAYFEQDNLEQTNYLRLMLSNESGDANFIYIGDRPQTGLLSATTTFEHECKDITIGIQGFSSQGNLTYLKLDNIDQSIEISYAIDPDDYFIFNIQSNSSQNCVIEFSDLKFLDRQD